MKKFFLIGSLLFMTTAMVFGQRNLITSPATQNEIVQSARSDGSLVRQFEFDIPSDATIAIASDGEFFYIGRWIHSTIVQYNFDGTLTGREFAVQGVDGFSTLVYDGRYFWGTFMSNTLYKMDLQHEPPICVGTINSPVRILHCTFDPEADDGNGGIWVGDWSTDFVLLSLEGVELDRILATTHGLSSIMSTALDRETKGGPFLWTIDAFQGDSSFLKPLLLPDGIQTEISHNVTAEAMYDMEESSAGGMFIASNIVEGTRTLVLLLQRFKVIGYDVSALYPFEDGEVPTIMTDDLPDGEVGEEYNAILVADGDEPITWSLEDGMLPDGLSLSDDGEISGTPTTKGTFIFTVTATNDFGSDTKEFSILIEEVEVGIYDKTEENITITPNPFTNNIIISNTENIQKITINNLLGQTVKELNINGVALTTVDTGDLTAGVYMVTLHTGTGDKIVRKMIKKD
jgi:hypothetical protein